MLESVKEIDKIYHDTLYYGEWVITIFFTVEYVARVITVKKPSKYIFSFYGIIDFVSTIPLYLSFFIVGSQSLLTVRALRLLRVFRILKVTRYIGESNKLLNALKNSRIKIFIFLFAVIIIAIISGTLMYFQWRPQMFRFPTIRLTTGRIFSPVFMELLMCKWPS